MFLADKQKFERSKSNRSHTAVNSLKRLAKSKTIKKLLLSKNIRCIYILGTYRYDNLHQKMTVRKSIKIRSHVSERHHLIDDINNCQTCSCELYSK